MSLQLNFYKANIEGAPELQPVNSGGIISFGRYYIHHPASFQTLANELLPLTPSFTIVENKFDKPESIFQFLIRKSDLDIALENNLKISHIIELLPGHLKALSYSASNSILCYVFEGKIAILASKMNEIEFSKIYHYTSSEDILYHIHSCVQNYFHSDINCQLILSGAVSAESKISNSIKRYYPKLSIFTNTLDQLQ